MKKFYVITCLLLVANTGLWAQVPVMNPILGPDTVCSNPYASMSFTASASNSPTQFHWSVISSNGVQFSSYSAAVVNISFPQVSGIYKLYCYASNSSGISTNTSVKFVQVIETPSVTFSGAYTAFCQGSSTTLMASNTTNAGSSTLQYLWSPAYGLSSTNTWSAVANPTVSTTYSVKVSRMNCFSETQVPITIYPAPTISVTSNNNPMCKGEKATITISGTGITYSVNGVVSPITFTVAPTSTVNYVVSAVEANGCKDQMTFAQNVSLCLAVQKLKEDLNAFIVYPNPSAGDAHLRAGQDIQVHVYNQLGSLVRKLDLKAGEETSLRDLDPGVYLLKGDGKTTRLIITR